MCFKSFLLIFVFSFIGCDQISTIFNSNAENPNTEKVALIEGMEIEVELKVCTQDSDCIMVSNQCCACYNGGTVIAIHKSQQESYEQEWKKQCNRHKPCLGYQRCHEWSVQCQNSKCVLIDN